MAKKSKKGKEPAPKKKYKKGAAITQTKIGVLSSIKFSGTNLEADFLAGLNTPGITLEVKDDRGYDTNDLSTALQLLNGDDQVGLIATVGGTITELVAADPAYGSAKPFVSIDGGPIPGSPSPGGGSTKFRWRVSLGSIVDNAARKAYLRQNFGFQLRAIGILAHTKSAQSAHENQGWSHRQPVTIDPTDTANQVQTKFRNAFNNFPNDIGAVIISADPYFMKFASVLVQEANRWAQAGARRVCYPLQEYADHGPEPNKTTLYGPQLTTRDPSFPGGYSVLGAKAAVVLGDSTSNGTVRPHVFKVDQ